MRQFGMVLVLAAFALPASGEESQSPVQCKSASKSYSVGAVLIEDTVALACGSQGRWTLAGHVVHCYFEGRAYSSGARIQGARGKSDTPQICVEGSWHIDALPAAAGPTNAQDAALAK
ncbi:MAG: hypothetical protein AAGE76_08735 [Pseudomonadota bacterium]